MREGGCLIKTVRRELSDESVRGPVKSPETSTACLLTGGSRGIPVGPVLMLASTQFDLQQHEQRDMWN